MVGIWGDIGDQALTGEKRTPNRSLSLLQANQGNRIWGGSALNSQRCYRVTVHFGFPVEFACAQTVCEDLGSGV